MERIGPLPSRDYGPPPADLVPIYPRVGAVHGWLRSMRGRAWRWMTPPPMPSHMAKPSRLAYGRPSGTPHHNIAPLKAGDSEPI